MAREDYWYIDDGSCVIRDTLREIRSHVNNNSEDYEGYKNVPVIHAIEHTPISMCKLTVQKGIVRFTKSQIIK